MDEDKEIPADREDYNSDRRRDEKYASNLNPEND